MLTKIVAATGIIKASKVFRSAEIQQLKTKQDIILKEFKNELHSLV